MEPGVKFRCKLCGKLFKGQEFVRKHINLKHNDKLEEVRAEVGKLLYSVVQTLIVARSNAL
jgi:hypothetical protein